MMNKKPNVVGVGKPFSGRYNYFWYNDLYKNKKRFLIKIEKLFDIKI